MKSHKISKTAIIGNHLFWWLVLEKKQQRKKIRNKKTLQVTRAMEHRKPSNLHIWTRAGIAAAPANCELCTEDVCYSYLQLPTKTKSYPPSILPASQSFIQSCQTQDGWELSRTNGLLCIFRQSRKVTIHPSTLTAAIAPLESKLKKDDHHDDDGGEKDYTEDDYAGGKSHNNTAYKLINELCANFFAHGCIKAQVKRGSKKLPKYKFGKKNRKTTTK